MTHFSRGCDPLRYTPSAAIGLLAPPAAPAQSKIKSRYRFLNRCDCYHSTKIAAPLLSAVQARV